LGKYVIRRLALMVPVMLGISILVFLLMRFLPGDVIDVLLGTEASLSPEARATLRKMLGLDEPLHIQYLRWIWDILHADMGRSLRTSQPVFENLTSRLPITFELAFLSVLMSVALSIPLGIISAVRRNSWIDFFVRLFGLVGLSLPNFWLATMLILITSLYFRWLPSVIFVSPLENPAENLKQMVLPAVSLAMALMAISMRMTRSAMLEVLRQDYIRTARAKGLVEQVVLYRHALKNAFIPVITVVGIQMGHLLGGAVIIEQIFGLPGVGWMLLNGIYQRDYPVVQGGVLFLAVMFVLVNLIVDMLYAYLDPRIRYS
jgi:peptide/nickel transport system permease protein